MLFRRVNGLLDSRKGSRQADKKLEYNVHRAVNFPTHYTQYQIDALWSPPS